jgi:molecular chaperone GrpE
LTSAVLSIGYVDNTDEFDSVVWGDTREDVNKWFVSECTPRVAHVGEDEVDRVQHADSGEELQPASRTSPEADSENVEESKGVVADQGEERKPAADQTATREPDAADGLTLPEDEQVALEALATAVFSLDDRLTESQRLLARQSELAGKLHAENQRLRAGELRAGLLPLVRDLLRLYDDVGRIASGAERGEDLELIRVSLLDALDRNGIVPVSAAEGEPFDPKRHSVTKVIETDDAARDHSIAQLIRVGFEWEEGQMIRVAEVCVCRFTSPQTDSDGSEQAGAATGPGEANQPSQAS